MKTCGRSYTHKSVPVYLRGSTSTRAERCAGWLLPSVDIIVCAGIRSDLLFFLLVFLLDAVTLLANIF